jgi:predicted transposase/invertase (TIGR01784 family)
MKDRYINPFTDFGFKKIFGEELNKDLLIDFLNELLKGEQCIRDLTYKKTENLGSTEVDRKAIFDLYCENDIGQKFIVELQKTKQNFFKDRSIYYSTFPIVEQAERGQWNYELKSVYTVAILDFTFDDEDHDKTVVSHVQLLNTKTKKVFYDKLTYIYLQMPNFVKTEDELENKFDKWLYVFKNLSNLQERPVKLQERVFEKLFSVAEVAKFSPSERDAYEDSLKYYRDLKNSLDTAREEGSTEKAYCSAEIMIRNGETDEKVILYTGLTIEQVDELRKRLGL